MTNRLKKLKSAGNVREKAVLPIAYAQTINCAELEVSGTIETIDREKEPYNLFGLLTDTGKC